jgi:hypothetical protein
VGISAAVIRIASGPAAEGTPGKAAVTTTLRDWRDKSGRLLQASVQGIDGGTVHFVRRDGVKFTYPLADLGSEDQKYLAGLQNKSTPGADAAAPTAPGAFTDWMSRADYDTEIARQMGNGMYAVITESNSRKELRSLFEKRPGAVRWFQALNEPELGLREKHASYQAQGSTLISLTYDRRTGLYCATWVYGMPPGEVSAQRGKYGITAPAIDAKITVSTMPKR